MFNMPYFKNQEDKDLAHAMASFWGEFVATGDPNGQPTGAAAPGQTVAWPAFGKDYRDGNILQLDAESDGGIRTTSGAPAGCSFLQVWAERELRGASPLPP